MSHATTSDISNQVFSWLLDQTSPGTFIAHILLGLFTLFYLSTIGIDDIDNRSFCSSLKSYKQSGLLSKIISLSSTDITSYRALVKVICFALEIPSCLDVTDVFSSYKGKFPSTKIIILMEDIDRIENSNILALFLSSLQLEFYIIYHRKNTDCNLLIFTGTLPFTVSNSVSLSLMGQINIRCWGFSDQLNLIDQYALQVDFSSKF